MNFEEIRQRVLERLQSDLPPDWGEFYRSSVGYALVNTIAAEFSYLYGEVSKLFQESFLSTAKSMTSMIDWAHAVGYPIIRTRAAEISVDYTHNSSFPPIIFETLPNSNTFLQSTLTPNVLYTGTPVLYFGDIPVSLDTFTAGSPPQFSLSLLIPKGSSSTMKLITGVWKAVMLPLNQFLDDPEYFIEGPVDDKRILIIARKPNISSYQLKSISIHKEIFRVLDYGGLHESTIQDDGVLLRYESDFPIEWLAGTTELVIIWFSPHATKLYTSDDWIQKNLRWNQSNDGLTLTNSTWTLYTDWMPGEDVDSIRKNIRNWMFSRNVVVNAEDIKTSSKRYFGSSLIDVSTNVSTTGLVKISYLYRDTANYRTLTNQEKTSWLQYLTSKAVPGITFQVEDPVSKNYQLNIAITVQSLRYVEAQNGLSELFNRFPLSLGKTFDIGGLLKEINQLPGILAVSYQVTASDNITTYRDYHQPNYTVSWDIV
jgi:hypothetical protein